MAFLFFRGSLLISKISESQFGLRNATRPRETLLSYINVLIQRSLGVDEDLFFCFLDYNILSEKHF